MKHAIKSLSGGHSHSSARVVDGKLILSLPHAITPVVWQMDITQAKASALEVQENKADGTTTLVLKTPRGETTEIAPFEKRAQAVEALMAVSKALENAHGKIRPGTNGDVITMETSRKPRSGGKLIAVILGLILFFVLFNIWGAMLPRPPSSMGGAPVSAPGNQSDTDNGVPLSADEFLKGK